ncbi:MAG: hypothetical protein QXK06_04105 [Candidatus Diapherotrites archaeon]
MADAQPAPAPKPKTPDSVDQFFQKLMGDAGKKVSNFAAFFFIILAFGTILGFFVMIKAEEMAIQAVLALAVIALVAYYNRAIAVILFLLSIACLVFFL